jgi:hypothetical protein
MKKTTCFPPFNEIPPVIISLLSHFQSYAETRALFLAQLGLPSSCRDPFSEFSEMLAAALLNATLADSRIQTGYDLIRPNGRKVQVKYLSNPSGKWINEHPLRFPDGVDEYALVVFESLQVKSVLVFRQETINQVCALLRKKHPDQDRTLQFTQRNYKTILARRAEFAALDVEIFEF